VGLTGHPIFTPPTSCMCCGGPLAGEWAICTSCQQRAQAMADAMDRADGVQDRARASAPDSDAPIDASRWND